MLTNYKATKSNKKQGEYIYFKQYLSTYIVYPEIENDYLKLSYFYYNCLTKTFSKSHVIKIFKNDTWSYNDEIKNKKPGLPLLKASVVTKDETGRYVVNDCRKKLNSDLIRDFLHTVAIDCSYIIQNNIKNKKKSKNKKEIPEEFKKYIISNSGLRKIKVNYIDNKLIIQDSKFLSIIDNHKIYNYSKIDGVYYRVSKIPIWCFYTLEFIEIQEDIPDFYKNMFLNKCYLELNKPNYNMYNHFYNIGCMKLFNRYDDYLLKYIQTLPLKIKKFLNLAENYFAGISFIKRIKDKNINLNSEEIFKILIAYQYPIYQLRSRDLYKELIKFYDNYIAPGGPSDALSTFDKKDIKFVNVKINITVFNDYRRMLAQFENDPAFKSFPRFPKNAETLSRYHDLLVAEINKAEDAKLQEKNDNYKKLHKDLKTFEYFNDKYSIIVPESLNDIVEEGRNLHHCVGSYIDSILNKRNKIYFLRKNDFLDTPWFTIDIDYSNNVRQIHTIYNRNLNSVPEYEELLKFLSDWANKNNLNMQDTDGVKCHL